MMPYLIVIVGQQPDSAETRQGGGAGRLNKAVTTRCVDAGNCNCWSDSIVTDQIQQKADHSYPAAKPLWRCPVSRACCQLEPGLRIAEAGNE